MPIFFQINSLKYVDIVVNTSDHNTIEANSNGTVILTLLKYLAARIEPTGIEMVTGVIKAKPIIPYFALVLTINLLVKVKGDLFFLGLLEK